MPPTPTPAWLSEFADAVPAQMPGWNADVHTLNDTEALRAQLWDQLVLDGTLTDGDATEAVILTGPKHDRFIAVPVHHSDGPGLALGALRPPDPTSTLDLTHHTAPAAAGLGPDPEHAVATMKEAFLPDYERALLRVQIQALRTAAAGIARASAAWDDISGTLCDAEGWPIDDTAYADGKVARDASAWKHVETFLAHGPNVLVHTREAATSRDYNYGPASTDLRRLRRIEKTLAGAQRVQTEWEQVVALMDGSQPGSRELYEDEAMEIRNSEGWHYADELIYQGPALVRAAESLAGRADAERQAQQLRQASALWRSATAAPASPASPPAAPLVSPPAPRRSR
ncbi:hypothetical protein ACFU5Z_16300 [Streptomyces sp. NPDC057521]|uniref:hypothetical protein n=1 Tax=Streptomyces sp. NPDC057521 TaxID=3346156 RepID=UPI003694AA65